ncbi:class II fructose-1,6-bisphosphate aldolase [Candidatus Dojkabacteria bacterium]|nr:class II fructose-1,6-bisphosphate aldolase [Candidatus Dojkabacteria bacterium]
MTLVNTKKMFEIAYKQNFAIGAFNINNMEIFQGILEAAVEESSPVIIAISLGAWKYAGIEYLKSLIENGSEQHPDIPMAMHLDHGDSFESCKKAVDAGFTSVMIDASKEPFEKNIEITKRVVEYAHEYNVTVEAELGQLGGVEEHVVGVSHEDISKFLTNPDQAVEFVEKTNCDSLAIACGTSHGAYKFKSEPKLAFDVIENTAAKLPGVPLVMHGSSNVPVEFKDLINKYGGKMPDAMGVPDKAVTQAAKLSICKINIDTDLRMAMTAKIREVFATKPEVFDPRKYLGPGRAAIKEQVKHKINILGSSDKAEICN